MKFSRYDPNAKSGNRNFDLFVVFAGGGDVDSNQGTEWRGIHIPQYRIVGEGGMCEV